MIDSEYKQPFGIGARWVLDQRRGIEILQACIRYVECRKKIPEDWLDELIGINEREHEE